MQISHHVLHRYISYINIIYIYIICFLSVLHFEAHKFDTNIFFTIFAQMLLKFAILELCDVSIFFLKIQFKSRVKGLLQVFLFIYEI
jgi:hypothetical protein